MLVKLNVGQGEEEEVILVEDETKQTNYWNSDKIIIFKHFAVNKRRQRRNRSVWGESNEYKLQL